MHEDPQLDRSDVEPLTERYTVPPVESNDPAVEASSVEATADAAVESSAPIESTAASTPPVDRYTPASDPRPDWTRELADQDAPPTPERWFEPAPTSEPVVPV